MRVLRRVLAAAVVLALVCTAAAAFLYVRDPGPGGAVDVAIPAGASTGAIAALLQREGVIGSALAFRVAAKVRRMDGRIQAGRYELRTGMSYQAVLDALGRPPVERCTPVTVPEGFTVRQVAARVGARTHLAEADVLAAARGAGVDRPDAAPEGAGSLEGFLFPETYCVGDRETAAGLISRMVREYEERTSEADFSYPRQRGLSPYQALVIASLVEREAKVEEDQGKVAAVIYNRLARGMRLQIDATALYDLPEHKVPTRRDLQRPSPYNTYLIDGLPPTPICNPGRGAIEAALHPPSTDDIFYVVIDPSGRHGFTDDPAEFERLKRLRPAEVRGG